MTYQEAKKLVKERAGSKYTGTRLRLLEKMVTAFYNPKRENDTIENVKVTKRKATLYFWAGVQDKQLSRVLASMDEVQVISRKNGAVTFTLSLEGLKELPKTTEVVKRRARDKNATRAAKATKKRTEIREQRTNALASCIAVAIASGMVPPPWQPEQSAVHAQRAQ
jgi:hypothetical protein